MKSILDHIRKPDVGTYYYRNTTGKSHKIIEHGEGQDIVRMQRLLTEEHFFISLGALVRNYTEIK